MLSSTWPLRHVEHGQERPRHTYLSSVDSNCGQLSSPCPPILPDVHHLDAQEGRVWFATSQVKRGSVRVARCQASLLSVSADVLDLAVNYSLWDPGDFATTLGLVDNVMGGYNASPAGIVSRDSLGEAPATM